jgi:hypothetical protein
MKIRQRVTPPKLPCLLFATDKMFAFLLLLSFLEAFLSVRLKIDCSGFSLAPHSEFPYAYVQAVLYGSWQATRSNCKSLHSQCDQAISRNEATRVHLNSLMLRKLDEHGAVYQCFLD